MRAAAAELFDLVARGIIKIEIGATYPLADAARAHRDIEERRPAGSLLLLPWGCAGQPRLLLLQLRLDPERLRDGGDLGALLGDRCRELGRSARIDHLRRGGEPGDTAGSLVTATMSAPICSISSFGRVLIPNSPTRPSTSSAGKPASAAVGTSGRIGARVRPLTSSGLDAAGLGLRLQDGVGRHVDLQASFADVGRGLHDVAVGHLLQLETGGLGEIVEGELGDARHHGGVEFAGLGARTRRPSPPRCRSSSMPARRRR